MVHAEQDIPDLRGLHTCTKTATGCSCEVANPKEFKILLLGQGPGNRCSGLYVRAHSEPGGEAQVFLLKPMWYYAMIVPERRIRSITKTRQTQQGDVTNIIPLSTEEKMSKAACKRFNQACLSHKLYATSHVSSEGLLYCFRSRLHILAHGLSWKVHRTSCQDSVAHLVLHLASLSPSLCFYYDNL